jgi:hypothetical protein
LSEVFINLNKEEKRMGKGFGFVATCGIGSAIGIACGLLFPLGLIPFGIAGVVAGLAGSGAALVGINEVASNFAEYGDGSEPSDSEESEYKYGF